VDITKKKQAVRLLQSAKWTMEKVHYKKYYIWIKQRNR